MCQNCSRLKQVWVKSPSRDALGLLQQRHEKVMEDMSLKRSLCSYEPLEQLQEGKRDLHRAASTAT